MFISSRGKSQLVKARTGLPDEELQLNLVGLNHRSAPVDVRERFSVEPAKTPQWLAEVASSAVLNEAMVVSTCNRTEIIAVAAKEHRSHVSGHVEVVFEKLSGLPRKQFSGNLYHLSDREAVEHVFRVASGLDSLVIGEPQVLGQLKDAYAAAKDHGTTRAFLNRLLQHAFAAAKAVRTRTKIGQNAVSVCSAAKELAEKIFGDLDRASVMLIGAGDMGTLTLRHMRAAGVEKFYVVNKTLSRAADLAESVGGAAMDLRGLGQCLKEADIVIGAAAGTVDPLVGRAAVEQSLKERSRNPQFFIDLAVPRNFDAAIGDLSDAFLYNIDNLKAVVAENMDARVEELKYAEVIVAQEVDKFSQWQSRRVFDSTIREVRSRLRGYQDEEVEKTLRRLRRSGFTAEQCRLLEAAVRDLSDALVAKSLHRPIAQLKQASSDRERTVTAFRRFFLDEGDNGGERE